MKRPISAHHLQPERPHCPSCYAPFDGFPNQCPRCDFSFAKRAERFPFQLGHLAGFDDSEGSVDTKQEIRINKAITAFETRFPQTAFHIVLTRLPENADVREFGFWVFNTAPPGDAELKGKERRYAILLLIDRNSRKASLTLGYGLDAHLGDDTSRRLMAESIPDFKARDYPRGMIRLIRSIRDNLELAHTEAIYTAQKFAEL